MTVSVIVPTYNRPDCVRRCLECLFAQTPSPNQIIVVDASVDFRTREVVDCFPEVIYLRNDKGRGNTPNSRNMALKACTGDIIAFLDDDAFVHSGWVANMLSTYSDPSVAGVAGRALNHRPGEATAGADKIGQLMLNGTLTGYFAADPGKIVEVDHMIGCNMSFRRDVIAQLGGFRDDYRAGPFGICEETEICVRAKRMGYRLVFNPAVCADHVGAPQPGGRRFSAKYAYYHNRNNLIMLIRNYSLNLIVWRHIATIAMRTLFEFGKKILSAIVHLSAGLAGIVAGLMEGITLLLKAGTNPIRKDARGQEIRVELSTTSGVFPPVITSELVSASKTEEK